MSILSDEQLALMRRRLADAGIAENTSETEASGAVEAPEDGGLHTAERRMWKIYQIDPNSDAHNFAVRLDFGPTYDIATVVSSLERLISTSQVLSSVIEVDDEGTPRRRDTQWAGTWLLPGEVWEWGSEQPDSVESALGERGAAVIDAAATELATKPFRLTEEAPGRARVYRHDNGITLILVLHHLAGDETILPPVLSILAGNGTGGHAGGNSPDPVGTADERLRAALAHARSTWAAEGIRYPLSGELPLTSPEESWFSVMGEGPGRLLTTPIDDGQVAALGEFARQVGATSNALYIVLSALTIHALTDAADFVLLVPADNRRADEPTDLVGYSGNIVPMRFTFDRDDSVSTAVGKAVATVYEAMEHSSVDYGSILTGLRNSGGRFPVAEVMALAKNAPLRGVALPEGATASCHTIFKGVVHYPLSLAFEIDEHDGVLLEVEYRTDVLEQSEADDVVSIAVGLVRELPREADSTLGDIVAGLRIDEAAALR